MTDSKIVAVFDIDGVFTDGTFWQNKEEKFLKRFGPDDFDALDELSEHMLICLITADKKGYDIVQNRFESKGRSVNIVSNKPKERWDWIEENHPGYTIIYIGDGIFDWYSLSNANLGITTVDALEHVQDRADYISPRTGSNRFVADACLYILKHVCQVDSWMIGT